MFSEIMWPFETNLHERLPAQKVRFEAMCPLPSRFLEMNELKIALKNCHGIRSLEASIDFSSGNAVAIYAPNGTMKTSFARTFADLAKGSESSDRMFPERESQRDVTNEACNEIDPEDIVVVLSYDEELGPTESTSTLLVNSELRTEYENLQVELLGKGSELVSAIATQSHSRQDLRAAVSDAFMQESDKFFEALVRVEDEIQNLEDDRYSDLSYDVLFNSNVDKILSSDDLKSELGDYITRLNELLDESAFFSRNTFNFYNASKVQKALGDNGYFSANHSLVLHSDGEDQEVKSHEELTALIDEEKQKIADDDELREKLDAIEKALNKNADTRAFFELIASRIELLPDLRNPPSFRQAVLKSYLKSQQDLYLTVIGLFKSTRVRLREIEKQAKDERTQWEEVIQIFNDRFFVPFRLSAKNKSRVMLGEESILKLVFEFDDGEATAGVERDELLSILSNGEKKALYILNVLFEMEARKKSGRETLFVIDDLADSFDYKNKYAIIQYLKEMSEHANFRLVLLTHNFDFFRTLLSRGVVGYNRCLMAQKGESKIILSQAEYVNNPFVREFKKNFFVDGMQRIASIPFTRNILEYTRGTEDSDYVALTSLLHWKSDSGSIANKDLDRVFNDTFRAATEETWDAPDEPVLDLTFRQADLAVNADEGVNFENKIVLSIATRILAEKYMVNELNDPDFVSAISGNQTQVLYQEFKRRDLGSDESREILDRVVLMTPENIHVNSFMYEPIIDMSDIALRNLYADVKTRL